MLDFDVSEAVEDFLSLAPNGGIVTVKQPPSEDHTGWGSTYSDKPKEHEIKMLVLPPGSPQSSTQLAEFEFYGQMQPNDRFAFAPTPIEDVNTGATVEIQEATSDNDIGTRIVYQGKDYRIAGEVWNNEVSAGYRSFYLKPVK